LYLGSVNNDFPLDLIVRTPKEMAWRPAEGDSFLEEVVSRGKILSLKKTTAEWVRKAEADYRGALTLRS
jgi:hypothetical protein